MTARRRGPLLALLALVLGGLAASDVASQEAALRRRLGRTVSIVVARATIPRGAAIRPGGLALRTVPARYAPRAAYARVGEVAGRRAAVVIPAGADITPALVAATAPQLRRGERVVAVDAAGDLRLLPPGTPVDVLATHVAPDGTGTTRVVLRDVVVASAERAEPDPGRATAARVTVGLQVTLRQALWLTTAQDGGDQLRVLPGRFDP